MAIRVYTQPDENVLLKEDFMSCIEKETLYLEVNPYQINQYPWKMTRDGKVTMTPTNYRGRAFFRVSAYRGCGMVSFELEPNPDSYLEYGIYTRYHDTMINYLYSRFNGRFHLLERTPFEGRRPSMDNPRLRALLGL